MSDVRAFVFDLDGTLLNAEHALSEATVQALSDARARGIKVLLASGRTSRSMRPFYQQLELTTPLISYNGARVDYGAGEVTERRLDPLVTRALIERAREGAVHLNLYGDDLWYTERAESAEARPRIPAPTEQLARARADAAPHTHKIARRIFFLLVRLSACCPLPRRLGAW